MAVCNNRMMPLRIHCPNGCLIRLPSSRAGKIVRCSICKSTLRLPEVSRSEIESGKPIPVRAEFVGEAEDDVDQALAANGDPDNEAPVVQPADSNRPFVRVGIDELDSMSAEMGLENGPNDQASWSTTCQAIADSKGVSDRDQANGVGGGSAASESTDLDSIQVPDTVSLNQLAKQLEVGQGSTTKETRTAIDSIAVAPSRTDTQHVADQQKKDHKTLARFYGFCIATLGLVSLVPAIIMLIKINQADMSATTPRWIYLLIFVGALHVVYAVYLIQIADWSALWSVSIMMLVATFFYGIFSTAILLDDGFGPVVRFLQLSVAQMRGAAIWCLIGLCFSVLTSYLCGRESLQWRRNEKRMFDIALQRNRKQASSPDVSEQRSLLNT